MSLEGKTALITGASRNIGREIALTFAREGADLVLNTRSSRQELEAVAAECRELGAETHTVVADVSDSAQVSSMVRKASKPWARSTFWSATPPFARIGPSRRSPMMSGIRCWE